MTEYPIRPITSDEFPTFARAAHLAFGGHTHESELERIRIELEEGRSLAAFDGDRIVGTAAGVGLDMTVPGGIVPTLGVTSVGVLPTHRRRGLLTALMRRQLHDAYEAGVPTAALWASEGAIYGRFGYGLATLAANVSLNRTQVRLLRPADPATPPLRLADKDEALVAITKIYEEVRPHQPGLMSRPGEWQSYRFWIPEHEREGFSDFFFAIHDGVDGHAGYVVYRTKGDWPDGSPAGVVEVEELVAAAPEAYESLWRYLLGLDLTLTIEYWAARPDEPLLHMVNEPRRLKLRVSDGMWVRLLDVPTALSARRYVREGTLTLELRDELCPWNAGRYRLDAGPDGAECVPTDDEPDLVMSAAELGAAYLGGTRFASLAEARRVREVREGGVGRADSLFGWPVTPWCPHRF